VKFEGQGHRTKNVAEVVDATSSEGFLICVDCSFLVDANQLLAKTVIVLSGR